MENQIEIYDDSSISALKGAERVRKRPEALLGSKGIEGALHGIVEIMGNALDEVSSGYGDRIDVQVYTDGSISIRDYGRGVPLGWNEKEQAWNWHLIYEETYAGGKYGDAQKELRAITDWSKFDYRAINYLFSVGLNGLGAAATQCSSEYFIVRSYRDGVMREMDYKEGNACLDELIEEKTSEPNGTFAKWKPDAQVFTDVNIPDDWVKRFCKQTSYVAEVEVHYINNRTKEDIVFPKSNILDSLVGDGEGIYDERFTHDVDASGDVCLCVSRVAIAPRVGNTKDRYFNNMIPVKGGVHSDAVNTAMKEFFTARGKEQDIKVNLSDYSNLLSVVISTMANKVSYRGQTKDSLDDWYIYTCIKQNLTTQLDIEWKKQSPWIQEVVEKCLAQAQKRKEIEALSKTIKVAEKATKARELPSKFTSCINYSKRGSTKGEVELWICEGDSAKGSIEKARDATYQCLFPIRGKSRNVFKSTVEQILDNEEIKGIISILGCGVDIGDEESFNIDNLRCDKIVFASDADVDGFHIRMLLFLIFYRLFPQLLYDGKVYIAETPRYMMTDINGDVHYCRDDHQRDLLIEKHGEDFFKKTDRFKGLGSVNASILRETTVQKGSRNLVQIKVDPDDMDIYDTIEVLFGRDTNRRKQAIMGALMEEGTESFDEVMSRMGELVANFAFEEDDEMEIVEVEY